MARRWWDGRRGRVQENIELDLHVLVDSEELGKGPLDEFVKKRNKRKCIDIKEHACVPSPQPPPLPDGTAHTHIPPTHHPIHYQAS